MFEVKSIEAISLEIKKCKFVKADMPEYIHKLLKETVAYALEDSEDNAFRTGKEEGYAQAVDDIKYAAQDYGSPDQILFTLDMLQQAIDRCDGVYELIPYLESELMRHETNPYIKALEEKSKAR